MSSISDVWRVWRHLQRGEFVQALARLQANAWLSKSALGRRWIVLASYRLCMYATVAGLPLQAVKWRGAWLAAVSLAACGRHEQARDVLYSLPLQCMSVKQKVALINALAAFMPEEALCLLKKLRETAIPSALHAGLLLRTGNTNEAKEVVSHALQTGQAQRHPELYLYETMAMQDEPRMQLERLNAFLQWHGVPKLCLRVEDQPPSPCNLVMAQILPYIQGPLVSVLMTTFRTGARASTAIESLLNQTYRNLEIIVVDDASDDDTPHLVEAWARKDTRVRFLRLSVNGGTYLAKSIGLHLARGEFVTCHDSDDWSHPVKIERQMRPLLEDPSLVATTSHWIRMQDDGVFYARPVHPLMRFNPSSPLFRREVVIKRMGGWDIVRTGADSEFYARLQLVFGKRSIKRLVQPLAFGSHREGSLMTAKETGYSDSGISSPRLEYWEAWSNWHIDCLRKGTLPRLPRDFEVLAKKRCFDAPLEVVLSAAQVREAMRAI